MATMYPTWLPAAVKSSAERALFALLRDHLPHEYLVLWSIDWTTPRPAAYGAGAQESEIDFLVLHPTYGLLVLEVKGGGVGYDGTRHEWFTIDRNNKRSFIKDPFEQARTSKYTLLRELTQQVPLQWLRDTSRKACFGHAIVVPNIDKKRLANRPTRPEEFILDREDMQPATVRAAIDNAYAFWRRTSTQPLGTQAIQEIVNMYAPSWYVRPLLVDVFEEEQAQLRELTEQQFITLDLLRKQRRVAISGCAGSGKTFLLIEQARRLARRGYSVLVTCYNRNLADWLRRYLDEEMQHEPARDLIDVFNFHRLASRLCNQAGIVLSGNESSRTYDDAFAAGLLEASAKGEQRYDAILADEGQDFAASWWDALLSLLRSSTESLFYVFYDDNQRIYGRTAPTPVPEEHRYSLSVNCRTTLTIHQAMMCYYHADEPPTCKGPAGRSIERISVTPGADERQKLAHLLHRFTQEEHIPLQDIVLLTPAGKHHSRFREGTRLGTFRLSWEMNGPPSAETLTCCSIFAFKGMERAIAILAEPDKIQATAEREQLIYVALSRARLHLILLGDLP